MKAWRQPGFWLPVLLIIAWGMYIILARQDSAREHAFTLMMFVGLASSLNILLGYTGYVSFGHIVFFGLGGYTGFYFLSIHNLPLLVSALLGGLISAILAGLIGLAYCLQGLFCFGHDWGVKRPAFLSAISGLRWCRRLAVNYSVYQSYGGPGCLWTTFTYLWLTVLVTVITSYLVKNSRFGLGLLAIREDEDAAMVMGVKAPQAKTIAYMFSAFFPGIIGTLYFFKNGNVEPGDAFQLHMSIEMLVMVMLGGMGTALGPYWVQ
jgi:branched-chain amino acid transport system permease protein